jgi:FkbM family methyltransferase
MVRQIIGEGAASDIVRRLSPPVPIGQVRATPPLVPRCTNTYTGATAAIEGPPVSDPFRNVRLHWKRLTGAREITLDGIRVGCGPDQPPSIRNGLYKGGYESAERQLLKKHLKPGTRVLEIGGGIGFVGLLAASIAGKGNVLTYEANPALEPTIRANHARNDIVPELRMRAITTDGAPVTFHQSDNVISSSIYDRREAERKIEVESDAFADVIAEWRPDMVVMDVEGYEVDLLATPPVGPTHLLVELHPHVVGEDRIGALLQALKEDGFEVVEQVHKNVLLSRR